MLVFVFCRPCNIGILGFPAEIHEIRQFPFIHILPGHFIIPCPSPAEDNLIPAPNLETFFKLAARCFFKNIATIN